MTNPSEGTSSSAQSLAYRYTPELANAIEREWQNYWTDKGTFNAPNPVGDLAPEDGRELP